MNYETTVDASSREILSGQDSHDEDARRRRLIIFAVVAIVVVAIAVLLMTRSGGETTGQQATQTPAVTVIAPGQATVQGMIQATGTLAARREMPIGVVGEGGRVVSVPVDAGQWVRAGQVLAVIDRSVQTQQTASTAANIEVAKADARLAQANLDRALQLVDRGFISKADVDRLTATRDAAVARVRVAEAQYGERNARNAQLNIVAPASGLLLTRDVEPGQVVSPGSGTLFSIAKDGQFELLALVGESELAKISTGVTAQVTPVGTDKTFTGQVWQVAPVIDQQNRQGTARIALNYAPELRPGGFATATISSGTVVAPMLPESAILSDAEGSFVYIVGKGNKVERRAVKTGLVTENGIAVTEGLTGSEKVVLRAGGFLAPGDEVRPRVVTK
ncbi:secretion protein HylD [Erythrobacter sp. SG61-1L]|uniref:efflux RND transporter periplasmic adaptor subunit n=1 Tax=Erythrobacter sp. SG61-1L TaxID=1603897 RepID=UPI0006C920EA|nr:efflux RND transporter periplasmic adaptor subunit [Erythrobacter sp. SG61-1L]KPL69020.1 secretion protein HylD [Erythrobacter sp. SG61-1L]